MTDTMYTKEIYDAFSEYGKSTQLSYHKILTDGFILMVREGLVSLEDIQKSYNAAFYVIKEGL